MIQARIESVICGNPGDVRPVGARVSELRIHHGLGYRICFQQRCSMPVLLLAGGDKSTQTKDIKSAQDLARNIKEE
ncbi:MAG: type II toxin-antitoxin system RelE/ParE family toxin [Prochlorococcaceae cyanobacterium]